MKQLFLFIFMILSFFEVAFSGNYYVRSSATGSEDGSDWINAYLDLPSNLTRGDTFWIADGEYSSYVFDDAESGEEVITIKKAISSNHGTGVGWQDSYGDSAAVFTDSQGTIFEFTAGYYLIDGMSGQDSTNYGIKITNCFYAVNIQSNQTANSIILRHIEMSGPGWRDSSNSRGINSTGINNSFTLQNCYIHDFSQEWVNLASKSAKDVLIERCYFNRCGSGTSTVHSVGLWIYGCSDTMNAIIRYNIFENADNLGSTGYISLGYRYQGPSRGYHIYGNIFKSTSQFEGPSRLIGDNGETITRGVKIYNNTMVNLNGNGSRITFNNNDSSDNEVINNLWVQCENDPVFTFVNLSHNSINEFDTDIFEDPISGNYRLRNGTPAGLDLGPPFNIDLDGVTRGGDGVWDIGAYEFIEQSVIKSKAVLRR